MTYWAVNAVFLAVVAVLGLLALLVARLRSRGTARDAGRRRVVAQGALVTTVVLLLLTAVFDNVMIGVGLVGYDEAKISGQFVGIAPLEDFAYSIAALVLLPSVWTLLGGRSTREEGSRR
jgi:lycopene cyclase domain-containing protein